MSDKPLILELGRPVTLEISPTTFWVLCYTGPSSAPQCISLSITYVIGAIVTGYILNLRLEQIFYLEPLHSYCRLALVETHYKEIVIERIATKEVK